MNTLVCSLSEGVFNNTHQLARVLLSFREVLEKQAKGILVPNMQAKPVTYATKGNNE